ncbi:hypothetical protein GTH01_30520 [Gluconobacter thailandicus F149-1 = NBRC 100600]|nr:hypothetical protein GTH01_30520 [Gluconobacter thailandicus F149-1 = NBRC 100600]
MPILVIQRLAVKFQKASFNRTEPMVENIDLDAFIADRAYDADKLIDKLTKRGITSGIPPKSSRTTQL